MTRVRDRRRGAFLLLAVLLLAPLSPLIGGALASSHAGSIYTFSDGSNSVDVDINTTAANTYAQLTLVRNSTITSSSMDINYDVTRPSPGVVRLDIDQDGLYEWEYDYLGFGDLGDQRTFSDGSTSNTTAVNSSGGPLIDFLLPSTTQLQDVGMTVEFTPEFGGGWIQTGIIDHLETADVDNDGLPEPIFLQRDHLWPSGNSSPAIGYVDWSSTTGFSNIHWEATCDDATKLVSGDLNNDGYAEMLALDLNSSYLCIGLSNGVGTWSNSSNVSMGPDMTAAVVADLSQDGYGDVVTVHNNGDLNISLWDQTNGSLDGAITYYIEQNGSVGGMGAPLSTLVVDNFWGQGTNLSVAVVDGMDGHMSMYNFTNNFWVPLATNFSFDCIKRGLQAVDYDSDGFVDLVGDYDGGACTARFNGSGWTVQPVSGLQLANHTFADWNGNGTIDVLVASTGGPDGNDSTMDGNLSVFAFTTNGSIITQPYRNLNPHTAPREVLAADLDGDGHPEQLISAGESQRGLFMAGWHEVGFDVEGDGDDEGLLTGFAGDGQNGVDNLEWSDQGNITQGLSQNIAAGMIAPMPYQYGIEMISVRPVVSSLGSGDVRMSGFNATYSASFMIDDNLGTGNLSNSLNLVMLMGIGSFNVSLPLSATRNGSVTLEAVNINWIDGALNQVLPDAPLLSLYDVAWDNVSLMWTDISAGAPGYLNYELFRWLNGTNRPSIAHMTPLANGIMDGNNVANKTFDYQVRAIYNFGVYSHFSNILTVSVPAQPPPDPPDTTPPDAVTVSIADRADDSGGVLTASWTAANASGDLDYELLFVESTDISDASTLTPVAQINAGEDTLVNVSNLGDGSAIADGSDVWAAVVSVDVSGNAWWNVTATGPAQAHNNTVRPSEISIEVSTGSVPTGGVHPLQSGNSVDVDVQLSSEGEPLIGRAVSVEISAGTVSGTKMGMTDGSGRALISWADWEDALTTYGMMVGDVTITAEYDGGTYGDDNQALGSSSAAASAHADVDATLSADSTDVQMTSDSASVTIRLLAADSIYQPLFTGMEFHWSAANESEQTNIGSGTATFSSDGLASVTFDHATGGQLDISIDEVNLSGWLTLSGNPLTVEFRPPPTEPEPEPEPEPDSELQPVNITCEDLDWRIIENESSMTMECELLNLNPVRISVGIDFVAPTEGVDMFVMPGNSLSLAANESKTISLVAKALVNATPGPRTLVVTLPVNAGGWITNSSVAELDYLVIASATLFTPEQQTQTTGGIAGWMWGALAGVIVLMGALFILTTRRKGTPEEEEKDDLDWVSSVEGEFESAAPDRGTDLGKTRPLDDIMPTRARPRDDDLDEAGEHEEYMDDESYHVDADGVEWWKDEEDVWWYRYPDEDDWSEYHDE